MRGFDDDAAEEEGGACLGRVVAPRAVGDESLFLPKREAVPVEEEGAGTTKPWTSTAPSRRSRAAKAPCVLDLVARLAAMFAVVVGWGGGECVRKRTRRWCCCRACLFAACGLWAACDLGQGVWAWWWNEEAV